MAVSNTIRRSSLALGGLVLALVLFFAANILVDRRVNGWRADLTKDRLFTLSGGTRSVIAKIDEPITIRFYLSERLLREIPSYGVFAARVREMLEEYRAAANGKIRLHVIDPKPFSDDEDRAVAMGLQGVPVNQAGELVYFGIAGANSADKEEVIAFLQPERERFLEHDLTKLVFNLATPKKKAIGLLTTLPLQGQFMGPRVPPQPWAIHEQLNQFFDVQRVERDAATIPENIGVLVVVHPRDLPETTQYAIDQFVLRGGRVLLFVDPHAEGEMGRPGPAAQTGQTSSNVPKLLAAWGLEMVEGKIAGDRQAARRVNAGGGQRVQAVDYLAWITLREGAFDRSDVVTAETQVLNFGTAGILKKIDGATTTVTPLVQTSAASQAIDVEPLKMMPDPVGLLTQFKPSGERYMIVARVRGAAKSAFPDGAPKAEAKEGEEKKDDKKDAAPAAHLAASKDPINIVVVADTDLLEDRFWAQTQEFFGQRMIVPIANNGDFVINLIDNLSGSDDLISLRSRGQSARPFTVVQQIQREAELRFRSTEKELQDKLKATEQKLQELQKQESGQGASRVLMTAQQQQTIDQFRSEMVQTRRQLRDVQFELRRDIETLESWVRWLNIGAIPVLIAIFALGLGWWRASRRRAAAAA
jgi:ABC-type uncharacterized transport system involved in gliding motility auxiliary subunit